MQTDPVPVLPPLNPVHRDSYSSSNGDTQYLRGIPSPQDPRLDGSQSMYDRGSSQPPRGRVPSQFDAVPRFRAGPAVMPSADPAAPIEVFSSLPSGSDRESSLVRDFLTNHQLGLADAEFIEKVVQKISKVSNTEFHVVGSHADGTASRTDSTFFTVASESLKLDRLSLCELLKAHGPTSFWTASVCANCTRVILVTSVERRVTARVITEPTLSQLAVRRTLFVRMHTQFVEPRMAVAVAGVRSRLKSSVNAEFLGFADYFIFVILWRALVQRRIIPNLLNVTTGLDGRVDSDRSFWKSPTEKPNDIRNNWRAQGICVSARMGAAEMVDLFIESAKQVLAPRSQPCVCPVTQGPIFDEGLTVPYGSRRFASEVWRTVCQVKQ